MTDFAPPPRPRRPRRRAPATRYILFGILAGFVVEGVNGGLTDPYALASLGAVFKPLIFEEREYWRLVSAMFLHGNGTLIGALLHLAVNVLSLVQLGGFYELMFGTWRFVTVYFGAGILASLTSAYMTMTPSVGASGAIFGIVGAFMISVWRSPHYRRERRARSIVFQLIFWTIINTLIALRIPQIDMSAHLGGLIAGALIALILPRAAPPPPLPPAQMVIEVRPHEHPDIYRRD